VVLAAVVVLVLLGPSKLAPVAVEPVSDVARVSGVIPHAPYVDLVAPVSAAVVSREGISVKFLNPLPGLVTQGFGPSRYEFEPTVRGPNGSYTHFHTGLDISAPYGTAVMAAADGVVQSAGWQGGYGLTVVLMHSDGTRTVYGHLSRARVRAGDRVAAGETIAFEGATGNSTGPHLHFEVRPSDQTVANPNAYLNPDGALQNAPAVRVDWGVSGEVSGGSRPRR